MALFDINDEKYRALWRDKLFEGDDWNIIPEAPPSDPSSRRRLDLKAKKGAAGVPEIQEVEQQALTACQAWLVDNNAHEMYAMTAFGISAKLWYTTLDTDYLMPMVPPTGDIADKSTYISAASSDAYLLRYGFEAIIRNPAGLPAAEVAVLKSNSTPPRSSTYNQSYIDFNSMSPTTSGIPYPHGEGMDFNIASGSSGYGHDVPMSSGYGSQSDASTDSVAALPDDAQYVEVKLRIDEGNQYSYVFEHEGMFLECYFHTQENGLKFWTETLDPGAVQKYE
ncbi:hypothetical protein F5884DRAFT_858426 [Xylogone sp. PMI_703]|nr:hypothetical protein F5884DRAFT_858426 [Xylogone sp. PMI_703]